jgi:hypothetical protein
MMFAKGKGAALGLVEGRTVIDVGAADPSLLKDPGACSAPVPVH